MTATAYVYEPDPDPDPAGGGADPWHRLDAELGELILPRPYCPVEATVKQEWFLLRDELEVFFGGAAGPGKSWGLLMAALQYVLEPGYHALLLRPTLTEFEQQGGLIELSHEWLGPTDAWWHGGRREWKFPAGSSVRFGYLATESHLSHYPGGGVSFLGFDELTLFTERLYLGMFRLLRQPVDRLKNVPVRVRSASNPGNVGHEFVKGRFIDPVTREPGSVFIPATFHDNPHLNYEEYLATLSHMHPVDRERLIKGDWDVAEEGGKFNRHDFQLVDDADCPPAVKTVRYWDLAGTEPSVSNPDPDFTVGLMLSLDQDDKFTIRDINMFRVNDGDVETAVRDQAVEDGRNVPVFIEQDPGQAGKAQVNHYKKRVLQGYACHAGSTRIRGRPAAKEVRAGPVAAAVANKLVRLVRGRNYRDLLGQCAMFPHPSTHDDCVDALSGGHTAVTTRGIATPGRSTSRSRGRLPGVTDNRRPLPNV